MLPKVKTVTKERPSLYPPGEPRGSSLPQRAATFDSAYAQIARSAPVGKQDLSMLSASTASATEKDHHETNFYLFDERDSQEQSKSTLFGDYDASIEPETEKKPSHHTQSRSRRHPSRSGQNSSPGRVSSPTSKEERSIFSALNPFDSARNSDSNLNIAQRKIEELQRECSKKERTNQKFSQALGDLMERNKQLQQELDEQNSQIRIVQEQRMRQIETKGFLRAEDDNVIRHKVQSCMNGLRSWAEKYAVTKHIHITGADQERATALLRSHMRLNECYRPFELGGFFWSHDSVALSTLLNAELARFVTQWIFRRPFLSLNYQNTSLLRDTLLVSEVFDAVYQNAQLQGDGSVAHAWRSQTLRMVDPPEPELDGQFNIHRESLQNKERYYIDHAERFDSGPARVLFRHSDTRKRVEELSEIIRIACELSASLWKQKIFMKCWSLEELQNIPFFVASREMKAHHAYGLEDQDTKLDGGQVQMVVQPALLAFGNEEGKNYTEYKVWAKAVVLISKGHGLDHEGLISMPRR